MKNVIIVAFLAVFCSLQLNAQSDQVRVSFDAKGIPSFKTLSTLASNSNMLTFFFCQKTHISRLENRVRSFAGERRNAFPTCKNRSFDHQLQ